MIAVAALLALTVTAPPTYLAERVFTSRGEVRRVSVFRDGTVVLVQRSGSEPGAPVRIVLGPGELRAFLGVLEETYPALAEESRERREHGQATVEYRLAPPGRAPIVLRQPVVAVPSRSLMRLKQAIDGLELRLSAPHPDREDVSGWEPERGERVLLDDGREVEVLDVFPGVSAPVVSIRSADGVVIWFMSLDELRRRAVRRAAAR